MYSSWVGPLKKTRKKNLSPKGKERTREDHGVVMLDDERGLVHTPRVEGGTSGAPTVYSISGLASRACACRIHPPKTH